MPRVMGVVEGNQESYLLDSEDFYLEAVREGERVAGTEYKDGYCRSFV